MGLSVAGAPMVASSACSLASSGMAFSAVGAAWPCFFANPGDCLLGRFVAGVNFSRMKEFGQCALRVAGMKQLAALGDMCR